MFTYLTKKLGKAGVLPWLLLVVGLFYAKRAAAKVVKDSVVPGITPTNTENWFYRGFNAVGDVFDNGVDDDSYALGTWVFDITH